jgi:hypothetical protein
MTSAFLTALHEAEKAFRTTPTITAAITYRIISDYCLTHDIIQWESWRAHREATEPMIGAFII